MTPKQRKLLATVMSKKKDSGGDWNPAYEPVESIYAVEAAYISVPNAHFNSLPTVSVDMQLMSDNTRFYHGFSGSYLGAYFTNNTSSYRFQLGVHEWQTGSIAGSDARLRQVLTWSRIGSDVTLASSLGGTLTYTTAMPSDYGNAFTLFSSDTASYGYKGGCLIYGVSVTAGGTIYTWLPARVKATGAVGLYNPTADTFIGNRATVGQILAT